MEQSELNKIADKENCKECLKLDGEPCEDHNAKNFHRVLSSYQFKAVGVEYTDIFCLDDGGYQCGCGGDDHEMFDKLHGCECFCHGDPLND